MITLICFNEIVIINKMIQMGMVFVFSFRVFFPLLGVWALKFARK